jgi:hypothetical protein
LLLGSIFSHFSKVSIFSRFFPIVIGIVHAILLGWQRSLVHFTLIALVGAALAIALDFDDETPQIVTLIMSPTDIDKTTQSKSLRNRVGVRRDISIPLRPKRCTQSRPVSHINVCSCPITDKMLRCRERSEVPLADSCTATNCTSFEHLVGAAEE